MFLVTNKDNSTFGGFYFSSDSENETDNPNFYFRVYDSLESAIYLCPFFGQKEFNVWQVEASGVCLEERVCKRFSKVKSKNLENFSHPTRDKRIVAAILCSMNLVKNDQFIKWCSSYLNDGLSDYSKEIAFELEKTISDTDEQTEYFSCAIPLLSCVLKEEENEVRSAAAIFRSISDSFDIDDPIDLNKVLKIVSLVSREEIASVMSF